MSSLHGPRLSWKGNRAGIAASLASSAYRFLGELLDGLSFGSAQGGTFTFVVRGMPAGDAEEYVGNCAAQGWEPSPHQFKLSEEELHHPDKLHKSLALNLPMGENSCTGTGTAVLTGHR